ncbi:MAG: sensor histidine kinase [Planctomycetota bacterium]|jgi:signal transduction histidine kinase
MAMTLEADTNVARCCLNLVRRALPVNSAEQLLAETASAWSTASGHSTLQVSLVCNGTLRGVLLLHGTLLAFERTTAASNWSASEAVDGMASLIDTPQTLLSAMTVVPFEHDGQTVGGALIPAISGSLKELTPLAELCAAFIAQLRQQPSGTATTLTEDEPKQLSAADDARLRELKLEAMAEFAAGAGHEINNPVATIAGRAALLLKSETDPERRRALETIGGQAYRIRDMIGDAMTIARPPEPKREWVLAATAVREVVARLQQSPLADSVSFDMDLDDAIELDVDPEQFRVVVSCLVKNSLEACSQLESGRVHVVLQLDRFTDRDWTLLSVTDNGPGLDASEREHLFDPFFSGRQAGRGLGFGLSRCWRIVQMHGGQIDALSRDGSGLEIRIRWPQFHKPA